MKLFTDKFAVFLLFFVCDCVRACFFVCIGLIVSVSGDAWLVSVCVCVYVLCVNVSHLHCVSTRRGSLSLPSC